MLALTSPTCGGRSVGIVRLRTKTSEFENNAVLFYKKSTERNFSIIFGANTDGEKTAGKNFIMRSFIPGTIRQI
jgi:hypothetical protein